MPFSFLKHGRGVKLTFFLLTLLLLLMVAAYVVVWPVVNFSRSLRTAPADKAVYDSLTSPSADFYDEEKRKQWMEASLKNAALQAHLQAARLDSIYFFIDLIDSVVSIEIKGVTVRSSRPNKLYVSPAFGRIKESPEAVRWLSKPLIARQSWSSFVKHPFKIKNAPRDTLEALAQKMDIMKPEPVDAYCAILFDRNVVLRMRQMEPITKSGVRSRMAYEWSFRYDMLKHSVTAVMQKEPLPYHLFIDVEMPRADIVAMYRAVPERCSLVLVF